MATKKQNSDQSETPQNAYFLSLELENVRCFGEKQKIDFSDGEGKLKQWTIILGDNGTGKTTILQSLIFSYPTTTNQRDEISSNFMNIPLYHKFVINLSFARSLPMSPISISTKTKAGDWVFNVDYLISNSFVISDSLNKSQSIAYDLTLGGTFGNNSLTCDTVETPKKIKPSYFAYGASRKAGETSISEQDKESTYVTLFDETALLLNPEEWLLRTYLSTLTLTQKEMDYLPNYPPNNAKDFGEKYRKKIKKELEKVKEILKLILPDISDVRFGEKEQEGKRIPLTVAKFKTPYGWVEAKDLSLGYRTSMAWMVDFASRMFDLYPDSENPLAEPAVVLIDEIDLHLHPKWQRDLLDWLSDLCPNTQFIVTTHSPLIVQSAAARDANFAVCRREGDHVVIDQSVDAVKNWRTDQILTSDLFGLESSRPKEIEPELFERQQILAKAKLTKKDEKRLKEIEAKVGAVPMMENPLYDKMMDVIFRASEKLEKEHKNGK